MRKMFKKMIVAAFVSLFAGNVGAQSEITAQLGDSVTLTSTNEGIKYVWSVSTDGKTYYTIPDENERTLTVRVFGENYYRVRWTNEDNKSAYADTVKIVLPETDYAITDYDVTAGQGFVEMDGKPATSGINIPYQSTVDGDEYRLGVTAKLTSWTNIKARAAYFFHTPEGIVNLKMNLTMRKNCMAQFRLRIYDTDVPDSLVAENIISFNGTGEEQVVPVISCNLGKRGYNKYELECLRGNTNLQSINKWIFDVEENEEPYSPTRMMAPSVHIMGWSSTNPKIPSGQTYDWAYEEVMIPEEGNFDATYVMSLGVLAGYMGIQIGNNGQYRTILFSQWDDGDTDIDPNLPDHLRSTAVDVGEGVIAQRFGAEGTGIQSFRNNGAYWNFGTYVQFLSHCRNELATYEVKVGDSIITKQQRNMLVSAWWNAQDEKGWQYISTLRVANRNSFISSWYSFIEDFSNYNGQIKRVAYFRNGYARTKGGTRWFHFNKASFGHNDGGTHHGARNDIWQGVDENDKYAWKMTTGGFANSSVIGKCEVPLRSKNTPVDTINLNVLLAREELALEKEQIRLDSISRMKEALYDNTTWEMLEFSSEETSGEGTNGRAAQIIDGDKNTYWHSQWKSTTATLPHHFIIDMKQEVDINAFYFALSGGTERYQKDILIEGSLDNETWYAVYENEACPNSAEYVLEMDSIAKARYLKLTIRDTQTGVIHTRINEFNALLLPVPTSIDDNVKIDSDDIEIYSVGKCIYIDAPADIKNAKIDIYSVSGAKVVSRNVDDVQKGDVVSVHSFNLVSGIYTVRFDADGKIYAKTIVVK